MEGLLLWVPSEIPGKTVWEDIRDYFEENIPKQESRARFLARKGNRLEQIEARRLNPGLKDRMDLFMLSLKTERALGRSQIRDHFPESFFKTNYWLMLATMYVDISFKSVANIDDVIQVRFPAKS
jgi:oleate hydratase